MPFGEHGLHGDICVKDCVLSVDGVTAERVIGATRTDVETPGLELLLVILQRLLLLLLQLLLAVVLPVMTPGIIIETLTFLQAFTVMLLLKLFNGPLALIVPS